MKVKATKRQLVGRTIVAVESRPFGDGRRGTAYDPIITLDNGRVIYFTTQETDVGRYGVRIDTLPLKDKS